MEDAPTPINVIEKEKILESFEIKQDENIYKLNIEVVNQDITMNLLVEKDFNKEYEIKLTLKEIKQMHKIFEFFESSQDFVDYIKALINNKKLSITNSSKGQILTSMLLSFSFLTHSSEIFAFANRTTSSSGL